MKDNPLLVGGCPLCDIYLKREIKTKLHYPERIDDIFNSEFVILDCKTCNVPMVVFKDHVTTITKESWGRILYKSKMLFGSNIKLRNKPCRIFDHFHCHVENIRRY